MATIGEKFTQLGTSIINLVGTRASRHLDNLTATGRDNIKNIVGEVANFGKSQITNCLTEVPQRIKYTLENGTLTIKAGSVVIVPYGTEDLTATYPVGSTFLHENFKVIDSSWVNSQFTLWVELQADLTGGFTGYTFTGFVAIILTENLMYIDTTTIDPTASGNFIYFDTSTYRVTQAGTTGNTARVLSFPFAQVSMDSTIGVVSVNQVFNGMGYIGSTLWLDKGVKGLFPDGRNADGTLNNVEITTTKLTTITNPFGANPSGTNCMTLAMDGSVGVTYRFIESETEPTTTYTTWFNPITNKMLYTGATAGAWLQQISIPIASLDYTYTESSKTNIFTSLAPKQPFRAVDYNEYRTEIDTKISTAQTDLQANIDKCVKKTGDTMTGDLSITRNTTSVLKFNNTSINLGNVPATRKNLGGFYILANGTTAGIIQGYIGEKGETGIQIVPRMPDNSAWGTALNVSALNGVSYCDFPKCTTKATTTSSAASSKVAVVVQNYVNGASWYRVWSDGWIEQGGSISANDHTTKTVTLPKAFSNTNYTLQYTQGGWNDNFTRSDTGITAITKTSFTIGSTAGCSALGRWYACGY